MSLSVHETVNRELQMSKLDLEKAEEPEIKLPTSTGSQKKQENHRKTISKLEKKLTISKWTDISEIK